MCLSIRQLRDGRSAAPRTSRRDACKDKQAAGVHDAGQRLCLLTTLVRTTCAFSSRSRLMQESTLMHVWSDVGNCVLQQTQTWCPFTKPRHYKWLGKNIMMVLSVAQAPAAACCQQLYWSWHAYGWLQWAQLSRKRYILDDLKMTGHSEDSTFIPVWST